MSLILVIEDDPSIQRALQRQFSTEGYDVHVEGTGPSGLAACKNLRPDAAILDLMLPGLSGRDVCKEIKAWSSDTPVIVLSAIAEVADKVLLFETGADDYMTKPFSPRELLARVQAAIRRTKTKVESLPHGFSNVSVDFQKMEVHRGGNLIQLTTYEFKLLRFFLENPGRAITRDEIFDDVWGSNLCKTTRTVDNLILKLCQKLEPDPANPVYFQTIHGYGYKFVPQN
jgi:DNA-binding response OmpR family regulator